MSATPQRNPKQTPRPALPEVGPVEHLRGIVEGLATPALKETDAVKCQQQIARLDEILKNIAELQQFVGSKRKEVGQHLASLRQARPKARPVEGEVRDRGGAKVIFLGGTWYPYEESSSAKEKD